MIIALKVLTACGVDAAFGDPRWCPHPVRLIGKIIQSYEKVVLRWAEGETSRYIAGSILALGLPSLCYVSADWVIQKSSQINEFVGHTVWVLLGYTTLAARDLAQHAYAVYCELQDGSLEQARIKVSSIVGRDTQDLSEPEVVRATIETVAESTSDGVVAPLFYLVIGGPPLALAYKAINTLDSMIGHRTERYQYFGWASARCDDVLNWLPARFCGMCLVFAAGILQGTSRDAWTIFRRDGGKHESPNSGWPEAAMAGALEVQLGGTNYYDGIGEQRQKIGDDRHALCRDHIPVSIQLMIVASILSMTLMVGMLFI